jgi:hypothetical protein
MVGRSCLTSGQVWCTRDPDNKAGGSQKATETERGHQGCGVPVNLQEVVEDLGQSDLAPTSAEPASTASLRGLAPGTAWDADADVPGVIIPSVEADQFRGERCPWCERAYPGEEEAGADRAHGAGELRLVQRLIEAAWEHKTGCDVQAGRCLCLLALYLGLLPECGSEADLAEHLGVDPAALSRSKLLLPPELQGFCHLHHRHRGPGSAQL